jgi:hypothetical protein
MTYDLPLLFRFADPNHEGGLGRFPERSTSLGAIYIVMIIEVLGF